MKFSVFQGCKAIGRSTKATIPPCATRTAVEFFVGLLFVAILVGAAIVVLEAVVVVFLAALLFETAKLKNRMRTSTAFPDI
jgi:hypothetical protein